MAKPKKEISKELMFQKIMPSADLSNERKSNERAVSEREEESGSPLEQNESQQMIARSTVLPHKDETFVINLMEKLVTDNLESVLSRFKCCKCDRCKKDIISLSLNALTPKYVVAATDRPLPDYYINQQTTEVTTAIVRAVIKVKSEPRH